jgi:type III secretion protein L
MAFIVREAKGLERPIPKNKVIKAEDAWVIKTASEALAAGNARRKAIESAALAAFEAEQRRGYLEGKEQAKLEQSENMIDIISRTVDYFARVESQMVDLVLEAVRRIINDFDDRQKIEKVVENCLSLIRNQQQIMIKVHPDRVMEVREDVHNFRRKFPAIEQIEVVPDSQLATDACIIESDIGRVEASLSGQIEALRTTLGRVFSMPGSE